MIEYFVMKFLEYTLGVDFSLGIIEEENANILTLFVLCLVVCLVARVLPVVASLVISSTTLQWKIYYRYQRSGEN